MSDQFYYRAGGEVVGPVTAAVFREKTAAGIIVLDTSVRMGEDGIWMSASRLLNLFDDEGHPLSRWETTAEVQIPDDAGSPNPTTFCKKNAAASEGSVSAAVVPDDFREHTYLAFFADACRVIAALAITAAIVTPFAAPVLAWLFETQLLTLVFSFAGLAASGLTLLAVAALITAFIDIAQDARRTRATTTRMASSQSELVQLLRGLASKCDEEK